MRAGCRATEAKSSPAEKLEPAPVRITARTPRARRRSRAVSTRDRIIGRSRALSLSARFSATWAIGPSIVVTTRSGWVAGMVRASLLGWSDRERGVGALGDGAFRVELGGHVRAADDAGGQTGRAQLVVEPAAGLLAGADHHVVD